MELLCRDKIYSISLIDVKDIVNCPMQPKHFFKNVPNAWDDTKLLEGYPGREVTIARRKGMTGILEALMQKRG
ncbi:MAG: hypothetical protein ABI581_15255 [Sediminibacterium sp.]